MGFLSVAKWLLDLVLGFFKFQTDARVKDNATAAGLATAVIQADAATAQAKKEHLAAEMGWWATRWLPVLFALPVLIHWSAIFLDSTFMFGWKIPAPPGVYGETEIDIVKSFFFVGVGASTIKAIVSIIKR